MKLPNRMPSLAFVFDILVLRIQETPDKIRAVPGKLKAAFWKTMRSPEVRPFVWVYYVALLSWGIYGTFFGAPPTYVRAAMGQTIYDMWVWLNVFGTLTVMFGLRLEDKAAKKAPDVKKRLTAIAVRMQTGGHASMFFVLLSYELSAIYGDIKQMPINEYSIFVTSPYVIGCLLLTTQGLVRVIWGDEEDEE